MTRRLPFADSSSSTGQLRSKTKVPVELVELPDNNNVQNVSARDRTGNLVGLSRAIIDLIHMCVNDKS